MEKISKHIGYKEATSMVTSVRLGIDNIPSPIHLEAMVLLAEQVFEPCREFVGKPLYIHSFYRSEALNKAINGAVGSQHTKGEAIDIDCDIFGGKTNKELFDFIVNNLDFDQVIWEGGDDVNPDWIHVSYKKEGNRKKITRMKIINNKTTYEHITI